MLFKKIIPILLLTASSMISGMEKDDSGNAYADWRFAEPKSPETTLLNLQEAFRKIPKKDIEDAKNEAARQEFAREEAAKKLEQEIKAIRDQHSKEEMEFWSARTKPSGESLAQDSAGFSNYLNNQNNQEDPVIDQDNGSSHFLRNLALIGAGITVINTIKEYRSLDAKKVTWYKRPFIALGKGIVETVKLPWYALQVADKLFMSFADTMD